LSVIGDDGVDAENEPSEKRRHVAVDEENYNATEKTASALYVGMKLIELERVKL